MEHSKLPWKATETQDLGSVATDITIVSSEAGYIVADIKGVISKDRANTDLIITACNEHDTLKAKAEWADEAITLLTDILGWDGILDHSKVRISQTVDKAKEL